MDSEQAGYETQIWPVDPPCRGPRSGTPLETVPIPVQSLRDWEIGRSTVMTSTGMMARLQAFCSGTKKTNRMPVELLRDLSDQSSNPLLVFVDCLVLLDLLQAFTDSITTSSTIDVRRFRGTRRKFRISSADFVSTMPRIPTTQGRISTCHPLFTLTH